jgi:hypothetical protein
VSQQNGVKMEYVLLSEVSEYMTMFMNNVSESHPASNLFKFESNNPILKGLMLDKKGINEENDMNPVLNFCNICFIDVTNNTLPKLALANGFFHGNSLNSLPTNGYEVL